MSQQTPLISTLNVWAIIPAAGSGSRFSKTELKQYQQIGDKTVLEHTVSRLVQLPVKGVVLAIGEHDDVARSLHFDQQAKVHFCQGGQERVNSVLNALSYVSDFANEDDWVFVHDAARPCVTLDALVSLWQHVEHTQQPAILATPVRDTLKSVPSNQTIEKTVDRTCLWQAQTPQMARLGDLKRAIEIALAEQAVITDEASALEFVGQHVDVVMGRADNIKITYPEDLGLAQLILAAQSEALKK